MFLLLVLIPMFLVLLLNVNLFKINERVAILIAGLFSLFQMFFVFSPGFFSNVLVDMLALKFECDGISWIMVFTISIVAFATICVLYSNLTITPRKKFHFVNLILLSVAGMNGLVFVRDIFSIYVFIEIIAATSYVLIALDKTKKSLEASFKYLVISSVATVMMLSAIAILFLVAGSTDFAEVTKMYKEYGTNPLVVVASVFFIVGLFIKGGVMPFHGWLPDAYSASPTPTSVFLAGIVTKTTGIYTLVRLYSIFDFSYSMQLIFLAFGTLSIIVGAMGAINQNNFKRMLAYSSISQVGYIVLALGSGTILGVFAGMFHLFNHSVFKALLFVNASALERQVKTNKIDQMAGGLGSQMPVTATTSVIAFLSTAGIPPLAGFWSKFLIVVALWFSGNKEFAILALLASIFTITYFLIMQKKIFFGNLKEKFNTIKEAPFSIRFASLFLCTITVLTGLFFPLVLNFMAFLFSF